MEYFPKNIKKKFVRWDDEIWFWLPVYVSFNTELFLFFLFFFLSSSNNINKIKLARNF